MPNANTKHGLTKHPLYVLWGHVRERCMNPNNKDYRLYGGRGVSMASEWLNNPAEFVRYIQSELGEKPSAAHSLDRKNNNGNYAPGNIRWATPLEQNLNTRTNRLIEAFGATLPQSEWAKLCGLSDTAIYVRLKRGLSSELAVREAAVAFGPVGESVCEPLPSNLPLPDRKPAKGELTVLPRGPQGGYLVALEGSRSEQTYENTSNFPDDRCCSVSRSN